MASKKSSDRATSKTTVTGTTVRSVRVTDGQGSQGPRNVVSREPISGGGEKTIWVEGR
jgi:hypothetical protein